MRKMIAALLTLALVLSLAAPVFAEEPKSQDTVVLFTNDVHTYIDGAMGYDAVAALKKELQTQYETVLLVDAGDHAQGTAFGSMDKGKSIIELMNAAGYDLATLGNHEFDYGMTGCINLRSWASFPYISCNFYNESAGVRGSNVLDSYKIFEAGGKKIAFVGVTTPESFTKSTPAYFQDGSGNYIYGIAGGSDGKALYADVQKAIDEAKAAGADIVIGLGHLGVDSSSKPWRSTDVIANVSGLSAFIDGHSHTTMQSKEVTDKDGNTVILTQTGEYLGKIGKMTISAADGSITVELVGEYTGSDAAVKAKQDGWITSVNDQLGVKIGSTELTFDNYDAENNRLVRKQETNTGDFAADALYYLFDGMDMDVDVAIMNGGGVRNKAITGDISYLTCKQIHTFGNVACLQTITGQQLLDALEWGARDVGTAECGGFLHVSGITYEINTAIASTVQMDDKGVWTGGPTGKYRVGNVQVYNKSTGAYEALDLTAKYNLAGYNYTLRDLGDGFAMFSGAVNVLDYVMEDYMVLANYVTGFSGGVVAAKNSPLLSKYSGMKLDYSTVNGSGRITVKNEAPPKDAVILYTNDVHTYIDGALGYDSVAALKAELAALGNDVLLVDAGDHAQGTAFGSMDKGKNIIELMNAAGYDLATLGNHEFDYGMTGCINLRSWATFPYVSSNFYNESAGVRGSNVLDSYKIFEIGGEKVALIGITTPESFTKSTPAYFQDGSGNYIYGIAGGDDGKALYADVQKAIDEAKAAGATKIIALGHLGVDAASSPWTSKEVIQNVSGLDAFIDGHSHTTMASQEVSDKDGNKVLLTQTGEYLGAIGKMTISGGVITTELITEYTGSDAAVKAKQDDWITSVNDQLGVKIGSTDLTLDNYDDKGNRLVRKQETNTGDLAADALYFLFDNMDMDVDVAIMNGGGVRNKDITGDISYLTCKSIHTFGNVACLQTVTGQQILDALEWGARGTTDVEVGGFLHVSGITYKVDGTVADTTQKDDKGVWTGGPTGDYRVYDVMVYNKATNAYEPLDLTAEYNLAGYNYTLRDLGDGFAMFDGAVNVLDYVMEDYMVLANYISAYEGGVVGAKNSPLLAKYPGMKLDYGTVNGSGRIEIKASEAVDDGKIIIGGLENNVWMTKYGNVYMDCKVEDFFAMGFGLADLVTVKFLDQELTLPVVPNYSYVDSGKPAVIATLTDKGEPTGYLSMAINMGNFADTYGIATKMTDSEGNWYWVAKEGVEFPIEVTFAMAEDDGYMAEYLLHELSRTNNREDYPGLTDEEFANFRNIGTKGMGKNKLYRTSSPINPELNRNSYADEALEDAKVTVIMNLADSEESAKGYEGFADSYYAKQKVIYLNLGVDFAADDFKAGLAKGLKFFAENKGVYAIHCTEGKDRAGFVSALLECLMGAGYDEVVEDYMQTYENYYGVEKGSEKYDAIANSNIVKSLESAFGVEDLSKADLAKEAEEYIKSLGLTDDEIAALKANIGPAPSDPTNPGTGDITLFVYPLLAMSSLMGMGIVIGKKRR